MARGGPIIDGWVHILLKIRFRGERILRGSKFNVTDPLHLCFSATDCFLMRKRVVIFQKLYVMQCPYLL